MPQRETQKPKRDWTQARAKVAKEPVCRACGRPGRLEAAHIIARSHTRPGEGEDPLNIVGLCPPDHRLYDSRKLDLLPHLTVEEQAKAVELAGGIVTAYQRLTGTRVT